MKLKYILLSYDLTFLHYHPTNNPEKFEKSLLSSQIIDFTSLCNAEGEDGVRIEHIRNVCERLKETAIETLKEMYECSG